MSEELVAGRFRIERAIGRGIGKGQAAAGGRRASSSRSRSYELDDVEARARFEREIAVLARLRQTHQRGAILDADARGAPSSRSS